jgi:hypothetical protein
MRHPGRHAGDSNAKWSRPSATSPRPW